MELEDKIPENIVECLAILEATVPQEVIDRYIGSNEDLIHELHHSAGRYIRNNWGLWKTSPLSRWFFSKGIYHADDMSGIIFISFHRYINQKDIDLEGQIKFYDDFWTESLGADGYEKMKKEIVYNYETPIEPMPKTEEFAPRLEYYVVDGWTRNIGLGILEELQVNASSGMIPLYGWYLTNRHLIEDLIDSFKDSTKLEEPAQHKCCGGCRSS